MSYLQIVTIIISIVLFLMIGQVSIWAEEDLEVYGDYMYSFNDDGETITLQKYTGNESSLKIPGQINGYIVTAIGNSAFEYCENLIDVEIPRGIISIGKWAFEDCKNLMSIEIPEGVISIGEMAFAYCENLINVELPHSLEELGSSVFACCAFSSINLPRNTNIIEGNPFEVSKIEDFILSEDNERYMLIDGVLIEKDSMKLISYPSGREDKHFSVPEGVIEIGDEAFSGSVNLTDIEIPESVISIGYGAFSQCKNLVNINIPRGVTSIEYSTFFCCYDLSSIEIPESVTSIGSSAFLLCESLTSIEIPYGVSSIGEGAFDSCPNLTLFVKPECYAAQWAEENGINYSYVSDENSFNYEETDGQSHDIDPNLFGLWMDNRDNDLFLFEDGTFSAEDDTGIFYCDGNKLILEVDGYKNVFEYKLADNYLVLTREDGDQRTWKKQ